MVIWLIYIFLLLGVACWFSFTGNKRRLGLIIISISGILSLLLWDRYESIVWILILVVTVIVYSKWIVRFTVFVEYLFIGLFVELFNLEKEEINQGDGRDNYQKGTVRVKYSIPYQTHKRLYHGTTHEAALEIYNTKLWLIGPSQPYAVWMGDDLNIAHGYSGSSGAIVEIDADPDLKLTDRGGGVFIYEIPQVTKSQKEYYTIPGLNPIGVLDYNGKNVL